MNPTPSSTMKTACNFPLLIGLTLACLTAFPTSGNASIVLTNDDFTGVTTGTLNADGWYFLGGASNTPWIIATDNTSPMSGNVMQNSAGTAGGTNGLKQFTTQTLSTLGDTLTLTMDYHVASNTTSGDFGVEFLNSSTTYAANLFGPGALTIGNGYAVAMGVGTTGTTADFRTSTGDMQFSGTILATTSISAILGATSTAHAMVFTLTKVVAGTELAWSIDGVQLGNATNSAYSTFNTIAIRTGSYTASGSKAVNFDNISVGFTPEPSTWALLAFGLTFVIFYQSNVQAFGTHEKSRGLKSYRVEWRKPHRRETLSNSPDDSPRDVVEGESNSV